MNLAGHSECAEVLLEHGALVDELDVKVRDTCNPRLWRRNRQRIRPSLGEAMGSILGVKKLKVVSTAAMLDAQHLQYENGERIGPKQAQLNTMHSQDFQTKIEGLVDCNVGDLEHLDLLIVLVLGCYQPSLEV